MVALARQVETLVRQATHDRIRDLSVEEISGRVVIKGKSATYHTKQMALQGALALLAGERVTAEITVG
jgi:hypothetical protein